MAPRCLKDIGGKVKDRRLPGHLQNARNSRIFFRGGFGDEILVSVAVGYTLFCGKTHSNMSQRSWGPEGLKQKT